MSAKGQLFVVTGPSGVGKGTLIAELLKEVTGLELSVSATTRTPRPGEQEGVDYHFMDDASFEQHVQAGDFIEHAGYAGHRYGTLASEVGPRIERGAGVVLEIELQGARQVRERMPEAVRIFITPPSAQALRDRLVGRGTDEPEQIESRLEVAREELDAAHEFEHVIVNDDLDVAAAELAKLVRAEMG